MATQEQMDRLLGKALFDADFREQLLADPDAAAQGLEITLTERQSTHIKRLDAEAMKNLAAEFNSLVGRSELKGGLLPVW